MMNIKIQEFKNQKDVIHCNFLAELRLNYQQYKGYKEEEFLAEDYYNKFLLFSIYRAIESLLRLLVEERKISSLNSKFYKLLFQNLKSHFISRNSLLLLLDDLVSYQVTYQNIYDFMKSEAIFRDVFSIKSVNDIKIRVKSKDDFVYDDNFLQIYHECATNRNKLMHSNVSMIDLTFYSIKNAFVVYSYLYLLLNSYFYRVLSDVESE